MQNSTANNALIRKGPAKVVTYVSAVAADSLAQLIGCYGTMLREQ